MWGLLKALFTSALCGSIMLYCKWKENQEKYQGDNLCCYETGYPKLLAQNAKEVYAFQTGNKADHKIIPVFL